jgi:hypothetical protein
LQQFIGGEQQTFALASTMARRLAAIYNLSPALDNLRLEGEDKEDENYERNSSIVSHFRANTTTSSNMFSGSLFPSFDSRSFIIYLYLFSTRREFCHTF